MSQLTQVIALFYRMTDDDAAALRDMLLEQRKRVWATALRDQARRYGCNRTPNAPSGDDLAELKRLSLRDAESVAQTWNRDVERQIEKLYAENPRGNRTYYAARMEQWVIERDAWKQPQIALNTELVTYEFARAQFREFNGIRGAFIFDGGPPVCETCVRYYALGEVDYKFIRDHNAPVHVNCPHYWREVRREKIDCADMWLG